MNMHEMPLLL